MRVRFRTSRDWGPTRLDRLLTFWFHGQDRTICVDAYSLPAAWRIAKETLACTPTRYEFAFYSYPTRKGVSK